LWRTSYLILEGPRDFFELLGVGFAKFVVGVQIPFLPEPKPQRLVQTALYI
jgi:hypothetical protein